MKESEKEESKQHQEGEEARRRQRSVFLLQIAGSGTRYGSIRALWELTRGGFKEEAECKIRLDWKNNADEGSTISYGRGRLFRETAKHYLWWGHGEERVQKARIPSIIQVREEPQGSLGRIQLTSSFLCKIDMEKSWPFGSLMPLESLHEGATQSLYTYTISQSCRENFRGSKKGI